MLIIKNYYFINIKKKKKIKKYKITSFERKTSEIIKIKRGGFHLKEFTFDL